MLSPIFSAFVRRSSSKIDRVMTISNTTYFFLFRDVVIWPLTNNICRPMWRMRLHMWTKFSDDRLQLATCITEKVKISFKHEYRKPIWHHAVTSPVTSTTSKVLFLAKFLIIISHVEMSKWICLKYFEIFKMAAILRSGSVFLRGSQSESWLQRLDSQSNSLHFELLIDVLAQILSELRQFQNLTYFFTSWPSYLIFDLVNLQDDVQYHATYMDQAKWRLAKNCDLYLGKCDNFI